MRRMGWIAALLFTIPACPAPAPAPGADDAGRLDGSVDAANGARDGGDASSAADTGGSDAGTTPGDGGANDDASPSDDGGASDTGTPDDASAASDASGIGNDASTSADAAAGQDAGDRIDAGGATDAGSGHDAATTTCELTVTPTTGPSSTSFEFRASTNGTVCQAALDGGPPFAVPCAGMVSSGGFSLGTHEVTLVVSGGPSGATSCSVTFTVVDTGPDAGTANDAGLTSCSIEVLPTSGSTSTTFTATFATNGTGCTLSVDGFGLGSVPCVGSYAGSGALLGPGMHVAALDSATGPSGPAHCTSTFVVTP
ncbi:MAG: hypothetical protein U0234_20305 [Sandaracinus sp.]